MRCCHVLPLLLLLLLLLLRIRLLADARVQDEVLQAKHPFLPLLPPLFPFPQSHY